MRTILSLVLALAACGGGAVCAGCSDDGGGFSRDDLPTDGNLRLMSLAVNGDQWCQARADGLEMSGFGVVGLGTDTPTAFAGGPNGPQPCSWSGDVLSCQDPNPSMMVSMVADMQAMSAVYIDSTIQCRIDLAITEIRPR